MVIFHSYASLPEGIVRYQNTCRYNEHWGEFTAGFWDVGTCERGMVSNVNPSNVELGGYHKQVSDEMTIGGLPPRGWRDPSFKYGEMAVSWNGGTPKSSILIGFSSK